VALMQNAAEAAGLGEYGKGFILARESEVAAQWCQYERKIESKEANFITVDAGGGTVDFTAFSQEGASIAEVVHASGGAWGSKSIDDAFFSLLSSIFGSEIVESFQASDIHAVNEVLQSFQDSKVTWKEGQILAVNMASFFTFLQEEKGMDPQHASQKFTDAGFKLGLRRRRNRLIMSAEQAKKTFRHSRRSHPETHRRNRENISRSRARLYFFGWRHGHVQLFVRFLQGRI
jgi:molecular chaperone DnaK (HSP70)